MRWRTAGALMSAAAKVIDQDLGWKKLRDSLVRTNEAKVVRVGVQGDEAQRDHDGINSVRLAAVHEFGAHINHPGGTPYVITKDGAVFVNKGHPNPAGVTKPHEIVIPERSFIRSTIDEHAEQYHELVKKLAGMVIDGKMMTRQALGLLGARVVADIKRRIQRGIDPPLKQATIDRKHSSKPLIDKGQLLNSITHEVGVSEEEGG
jgi:hypothetical protein